MDLILKARSRFFANRRDATLLSVTAWLSVLLFGVSQLYFVAFTEQPFWSTAHLWSMASMVGLASSLGLSELRHRRSIAEINTLQLAAWTDELTGAINRRAAEAELKRRLAQFQRRGTPVSILLIDVDHFKNINDQWGHAVGDEVLKLITNVISISVREMDLVARFGGEEFIAILSDTNLRQASRVAERVRQAVGDATLMFDETPVQFTISIGLASAIKLDDTEIIIRRADSALYAAKRAGRNRVYICSSSPAICTKLESPLQPTDFMLEDELSRRPL